MIEKDLTLDSSLLNLKKARELLMREKCRVIRVRDPKIFYELNTRGLSVKHFKHLSKASTRVMREVKHTCEDFLYHTNSLLLVLIICLGDVILIYSVGSNSKTFTLLDSRVNLQQPHGNDRI